MKAYRLIYVVFKYSIIKVNILDMENPRYRGDSIPSKIFKVLDNSGKQFSIILVVVIIILRQATLSLILNLLTRFIG
jgi:hypothetical protein